MALSGSTDYSTTRDDLITEALQICGVIEEGGTPSSTKITDCSRTLNMMLKMWQADGLQLWLQDEIIVFLEKGKSIYNLGSSGDRAVLREDLVETDINGALNSGDTSVTVDSTTGMSGSDNIGIVTDDGVFWTTISSVDSSTTLTLASGVDNDVSDGAAVYTYTSAYTERPQRVIEAWRRDKSGNDVPLRLQSRNEYVDLSDKDQEGVTTLIWYDPQLSAGELRIWPVAGQDNLDNKIHLFVSRPIQDLDSATDNPQFPQQWYLVLAWGLAYYLCDKYGVPPQTRDRIERTMTMMKDNVLNWDYEMGTSLFLQPDTRGAR